MTSFFRCISNLKKSLNSPSIILFSFGTILILINNIANAQIVHEHEPNNSISQANPLATGDTMIGSTCPAGFAPDTDYFRIIPPSEGYLKFITSVTQYSDTSGLTNLTWSLYDKSGTFLDDWTVTRGSDSIYVSDTFYKYCMASDTFYISVYCPQFTYDCHFYSFSYTEIPPVFGNDSEPDNSIQEAIPLPYNTTRDGHLNFYNDTSYDFYRMILPNDGLLRIYVEAESEQTIPENINVSVFDKTGAYVIGWDVPAGANDVPMSDTVNFSCASADTFYVRLYIDAAGLCGFSYRIWYDVKDAVFGNDPSTDDVQTQAVFFPADVPRPGHLNYYGQPGNDWYKIYKSDTGNFFFYTEASHEFSDTSGQLSISFFDTSQAYIGTIDAPIGSDGQIAYDNFVISAGAPDTFYLQVSFTGDCGSYQLEYSTDSSLNGIKKTAPYTNDIKVFPNPSAGLFNFVFSNINPQQITLYDAEGRLISSQNINLSSNNFQLDASNFTQGFYYARIMTTNGQIVFIKLSVVR